jgi:anaerobic nitric oxide reductase flavorubredoxin
MKGILMVTELAKGVYWVGVVDWGLRFFHGHELSTPRGSTYNSYLIVDDKIALVDTVWDPFREQFMENVRKVIDPAKIDYVITNHAEVDHSGGLPSVLREALRAVVVVSRKGMESLPGYYHQSWNLMPVKSGDRLKLGAEELLFFEASMLHWPDTMFTYLTKNQILMPNDAFGQHYASDFRFNDQVNRDELLYEAQRYYVNIVSPYNKTVTRKIDDLLALNLPVKMIAPSHGVIWRDNPLQIVEKYKEWAEEVPEKRAVILYDTMWGATRRMAEAIGDGLAAEGVPYKIFHMAVSDRNHVLVEVFRSKAVIVGSSVHNHCLLPGITVILDDLRGLKFANRIGAAFGSYGWSGECVKLIEEQFARAGIPVAAEGVRAKWQPGPDELAECEKLGCKMAAAVKAD